VVFKLLSDPEQLMRQARKLNHQVKAVANTAHHVLAEGDTISASPSCSTLGTPSKQLPASLLSSLDPLNSPSSSSSHTCLLSDSHLFIPIMANQNKFPKIKASSPDAIKEYDGVCPSFMVN
jgi:hypothetical protein